jgi:hypothetical protein
MSAAVRLASRTANNTRRVAIEPRSLCRTRAAGPRRRSPDWAGGWLAAWLLIFVAAVSISRGAEPEPGSRALPDASDGGYHVGNTGLWLGGYATIDAEVPESAPAALEVGDLGLLVRYELTPSLAFFSEIDLDDTVRLVEHEGLERGSRVLLLERLYLDWSVKPQFTLRVGKFLTPFGLWNVVRRAPLTWTVDRPVATQSAFPEHTTGLSLIYQTTRHGWSLDATAYGQAQDELVRGASDISASAVGGGRVVAGHILGPAYLALGLSATAFENRDTNLWEDAYGADLDLTIRGNHLTGEFAYSHLREADADREWSFYLQDVFPLYGTLYGVLRFEHVEARRGPAVNGQLVGVAWRLLPHVVIKADYQFADHEGSPSEPSALERGFVAGVTLFF